MPIWMWWQTLGAHFLGSHAQSDKFLLDILRRKFHSREWTRRLLETGSVLLIEGNLHHDNRLGI
jgi:hypothetical protein